MQVKGLLKKREYRSGRSDRFLRKGAAFSKTLILILVLLFSLFGCGSSSDGETVPDAKKDEPADDGRRYEVPDFAESVFDEEAASYKNGAYIDISHVEEGYVAVSATSDKRLKFQVLTEDTYNYDLSSDGEVSIFPLQSGNGEYKFRVMENVSDNRYAALFEISADVELLDEFQPYIRSSDYSSYTKDSECVALASSFAKESADAVEVIEKVYDYVCDHVKYDKAKAESVKSGYLPDPDETLSTGKGICFDYASLAAAMLRSQGIPTKVIFGYVSPNDLYHAWNMFYTEESGWVTVDFKTNEKDWTRMDLTFSANGSDQKFIGDGGNYAEVYQY